MIWVHEKPEQDSRNTPVLLIGSGIYSPSFQELLFLKSSCSRRLCVLSPFALSNSECLFGAMARMLGFGRIPIPYPSLQFLVLRRCAWAHRSNSGSTVPNPVAERSPHSRRGQPLPFPRPRTPFSLHHNELSRQRPRTSKSMDCDEIRIASIKQAQFLLRKHAFQPFSSRSSKSKPQSWGPYLQYPTKRASHNSSPISKPLSRSDSPTLHIQYDQPKYIPHSPASGAGRKCTMVCLIGAFPMLRPSRGLQSCRQAAGRPV